MLRAAFRGEDTDDADVGWLLVAKFVLNVNALTTSFLNQKPAKK